MQGLPSVSTDRLATLPTAESLRPPPDSGPVEYYSELYFRGQHPLSLLVFEGGLVYGFYRSDFSGPVYPQFGYSGFFVATTDAPIEESATYRGVDFNFDEKSANAAILALRGPRTETLNGSLTVVGGNSNAMAAGLAPVSRDRTVTATLEGDYSGYIRSVDGDASLTASLGATGQLAASTAGGCAVTAKLEPRKRGNLYDTQATLGTGCPSPVGNYRGHAFQSYLTRNVYVMLTDEDMKHGVFMHLFDLPTQEPATAKQSRLERLSGKAPSRAGWP